MKKKVKEKKRVKRKKERVTNMSEKQKKQVSFYAKASDVKSAFYANQPIFVLLYKEACFNTNKLDEFLPSVVVSLLQEYEDVFPNDVPSGLPPIRGIEHQIDFVPGATIPNRPAYRSNLEEIKELQRQVEELLAKGHVRESMSPCTVSVLLVPKKDGTWRMCVNCRAINNITVKIRGRILLRREGMMGTKVGLALKILYKFQMGQLQDQEPRRSRKQCKDWCNPLGMKLARA
jgi:hypothetical protein